MSAVQQLDHAIIGPIKVWWEDLDFQWSRGTHQRKIKPSHVAEMVKTLQMKSCLNDDFRYYIIVLVDRKKLEEWALHENVTITKRSTMSPDVLIVQRFYAITGTKMEVQAGMHRLHALYSLTRSELSAQELSKPELERQLLSKVHWTALAIDSTKIRPEEQFLLELLRLNPDDSHLPDSEADIWKKWLNADAGITEFSGQIEQGKREVMLTRASQFKDSCLNTKVTERFRRAYTSEWKNTITKYLEYPPYYETFRAQDFDFPLRQKRIRWFWEGILSSTFSLLQGISQGSPDALDTTTLETLATLSIPRSQDSVHDLYYSSNG
ncbi:hypothetical protein BDZ91DRAFT_801861 [Kalaharituber pfeilii]|nr:hypothetical protein BDZ91DRAFT_801861 [Kalaharituber pfeilii]